MKIHFRVFIFSVFFFSMFSISLAQHTDSNGVVHTYQTKEDCKPLNTGVTPIIDHWFTIQERGRTECVYSLNNEVHATDANHDQGIDLFMDLEGITADLTANVCVRLLKGDFEDLRTNSRLGYITHGKYVDMGLMTSDRPMESKIPDVCADYGAGIKFANAVLTGTSSVLLRYNGKTYSIPVDQADIEDAKLVNRIFTSQPKKEIKPKGKGWSRTIIN